MIHNDDISIRASKLKRGHILSEVVGTDGKRLPGSFTVASDARWDHRTQSWLVDIEGAPTQWFAPGMQAWIAPPPQ